MQLITSSALKHAIRTQLTSLQTDDTPVLTVQDVRNSLYILDRNANLIQYQPKPAQLHFRKHRTGRDIIVKSRQIGFSTEIQAEQFTSAITDTALCATLAHDADTTAKLRRMATRFYENLPDAMRPKRGLDNATTTTYPATNSEVTIATAGSANIGRGGTYNKVHGSEVAFWKNADAIIAGLLQGVPANGDVVLESSPNGAQGYFFESVNKALTTPDESIWTVHFYPWWWETEYRIELELGEIITFTDEEQLLVNQHNLTPEQIKWRRFKVRELGIYFKQEYPEDIISCFLTSGGGVFTVESHMIQAGVAHVAPVDGAIYVSGQDWGQDEDYTALSVFRVMPDGSNHEVYMNRWRKQSWASMRAEIIDVLKLYKVEKHIAERNSMGSSQIEDLINDIESAGLQTSVQAFTTTNRSKDNVVKMMQKALSEEGLQLLDVSYANHELRAFQTKQTATGLWTYSHPDGGHDDTVDARLLANYAATQLWI